MTTWLRGTTRKRCKWRRKQAIFNKSTDAPVLSVSVRERVKLIDVIPGVFLLTLPSLCKCAIYRFAFATRSNSSFFLIA